MGDLRNLDQFLMVKFPGSTDGGAGVVVGWFLVHGWYV